ncbi:MAG: hypothetical protein HEEMFOPI_01670 [Holosporales bacterium]
MDGIEFQKGLYDVLSKKGFIRKGNLMRIFGDDVVVLIGLERSRFSQQLFVNIGIFLNKLDAEVPKKIEHTHMYFRLEGLFPQYRDIILTAGALDELEQYGAYQNFLDLLDRDIADVLKNLASEKSIVEAYYAGLSSLGLITKSAKNFILSFPNISKELAKQQSPEAYTQKE